MSLIHWWPLNGDLQDKIQGKIFNNGGWTSANSGKIGTTYNANIGAVLSASLSIPNTFSFACWVKNNDLTYPQAPLPMKFSDGAPYSTASTSNKGWEFSHGNNSKLTLNNGSTAQELNFGTPHVSYLGSWYHLVFTVDCHLKKASLFINGESKGEKSFTITDFSGTYTFSLGQIHGWKLDGFVNDIRIYDHALSQAEVKELSKALVVHYTFDDICTEPTTNIITGIKSASGKASLESGRVKINWSPSGDDSYFFFNWNQTIKANSIYTLSFDCEGLKSGEVATFALSNLSASSYNIALKNGRNSLTFTAGSDLMNDINTYNRLFFDDKTRTNGAVFYLSNFQLEELDHATSYTPSSREGMLANEAGYNYDIDNCGVILSKDAVKGSYSSYYKNGEQYLISKNTPVNNEIISTSVWFKSTNTSPKTDYHIVLAIDGGAVEISIPKNGQLRWGGYTSNNSRVCENVTVKNLSGSTFSLLNGKWHLINTIYDGNGWSAYVDGVYQTKWNATGTISYSNKNLIVGKYNEGATSNYGATDAYIDDVRIYNTVLTSRDIQDLYKTKAYVTDKGDMETHQFIEGCANLQITYNGCTETYDIQEIGNAEYEQLEYIASTGTQYIDTGVYWTSEKATIVADLMVTTWKASSTIFGSEERYSGSNRYFAHILHAGSANGSYANYIGTGSIGNTTLTKDTRSVIEYIAYGDKKATTRVTANGTTTTYINNKAYSGTILTRQNSTQTAVNRGNIYIFANHNAYNGTAGIQNMAAMRLYRFTMIQDDVYIRDFIPCRRKSDGKVGLFDLVTGQFYTSPVGNFTAGSVVTNEDMQVKFISGGTIQARQIIEL